MGGLAPKWTTYAIACTMMIFIFHIISLSPLSGILFSPLRAKGFQNIQPFYTLMLCLIRNGACFHAFPIVPEVFSRSTLLQISCMFSLSKSFLVIIRAVLSLLGYSKIFS